MSRSGSRFSARIVVAVTALALSLGAPRITTADSQVPFTATITTVDTIFATGCPAIQCFSETSSGTATHMGAITSTGTGVVTSQTLTDLTHVTVTVREQHTLTGANGSSITLSGTSTGIVDLTTGATVVLPWHYTITGGTGLYAGASGSGLVSGTLQLTSAGTQLTGTFTFTGTISSVGSKRP